MKRGRDWRCRRRGGGAEVDVSGVERGEKGRGGGKITQMT